MDREEQKICEHEKVYANEIMCSNPPQRKWICRKCGTEGVDVDNGSIDDEYKAIKRKFEVKK